MVDTPNTIHIIINKTLRIDLQKIENCNITEKRSIYLDETSFSPQNLDNSDNYVILSKA